MFKKLEVSREVYICFELFGRFQKRLNNSK